MKHQDYFPDWENAMRYGLLNGRPFSASCIAAYKRYVNWFFSQHEHISVETIKQALLVIPIEHFAKRLKLYESIRSYLKHLIDNEVITEEILHKIHKFKPKRHLPLQKFTVDEASIGKLLSVYQNPLDRMIVELLSQTRLRVSEATALTLEDINLEKGFLTVKQAKWGKTRRVGLNSSLQISIKAYLAQRAEICLPNFLISRNGEALRRYGVGRRLKKLGKWAGVKVSPHALRRAFVTINANKGRPLAMLQIACGHNDITTTRSYCMTTEDETIEAMQDWD